MEISKKWLALLIIALTFMQCKLTPVADNTSTDSTLFGSNDNVGRYIKTRGFNMYYEIYGKGEPLLIIHGNGGSISNFSNQIPYFSKDYKVIVADSRAHGKSTDAADSLS